MDHSSIHCNITIPYILCHSATQWSITPPYIIITVRHTKMPQHLIFGIILSLILYHRFILWMTVAYTVTTQYLMFCITVHITAASHHLKPPYIIITVRHTIMPQHLMFHITVSPILYHDFILCATLQHTVTTQYLIFCVTVNHTTASHHIIFSITVPHIKTSINICIFSII